jgi:hypothetical protein
MELEQYIANQARRDTNLGVLLQGSVGAYGEPGLIALAEGDRAHANAILADTILGQSGMDPTGEAYTADNLVVAMVRERCDTIHWDRIEYFLHA